MPPESNPLGRALVGHAIAHTVAAAVELSRRVQAALEQILRAGAGVVLSTLGLPVEPSTSPSSSFSSGRSGSAP